MAMMDAADLLDRVKRYSALPSTDTSMADADWYAFLSEAQLHWIAEFATHFPDMMYTQAKLTSSDSGVTYDFAAEPLGYYELRESPTGALLIPGPEWDPNADFVLSGNKIRFPNQKARTFSNGPWARYVPMPTVLSASTAPTLSPTHARILLIPRALISWAGSGRSGQRDSTPYLLWENELWYGEPTRGKLGLLTALVNQAYLRGNEAINDNPGTWYPVTTGEGYSAYVP